MERVCIWYITDNDSGNDIVKGIIDIGLEINQLKEKELIKNKIFLDRINFFIFDFIDKDVTSILEYLRNDQRIQNYQKFVFLNKRKINEALNSSIRFLHLEFLSRPLNKREFTLLLEKSVIVERFRGVMKYISKEAETRIETYESIMDINRRELFVTAEEKEDFINIMNFEKNLKKRQSELNNAISEYTNLRKKEMFQNKNRIKAEEMLEDLRCQERIDADNVIKAQENVIDFSSSKLQEAKEVINAKEKVVELGRMEAVQLHKHMITEIEKNNKLSLEVKKLKKELNEIKAVKKK